MRKLLIIAIASCLSLTGVFAQDVDKEQIKKEIKEELKAERKAAFAPLRENNKNGLHVFESPKTELPQFDGIKVRIGGSFNMMMQGMSQDNFYTGELTPATTDPAQYSFAEMGADFNLPQANFNIDVAFAPGMTMRLETYLSTHHHVETYVKGGYMQIDALPFMKSALLDDLMRNVTVKAGLMEINYGDSHFRRSDGGNAIYNPFVGNYIMDAFNTELAFEALYQDQSGFLGMVGVSNGKLNQNSLKVEGAAPSLYGKLGFDKKLNEDLRVRLTGSAYHSFGEYKNYIYHGDRAGGRYYNLGTYNNGDGTTTKGGDWPGRVFFTFAEVTGIQINPFVKFGGVELFASYDRQMDTAEDAEGYFEQLAGEVIYRFGSNENFYLGARYNTVNGKMAAGADEVSIDRYSFGGGWFLNKHILVKAEYMNQSYNDDTYLVYGEQFRDANFNGVNLEAVIAF